MVGLFGFCFAARSLRFNVVVECGRIIGFASLRGAFGSIGRATRGGGAEGTISGVAFGSAGGVGRDEAAAGASAPGLRSAASRRCAISARL